MKVLLIGGGGREHALGWKIAQSPRLSKLYLAPGNPGLNKLGEALAIDADDNEAIVQFAQSNELDLVVVGPEAPLAAGLADDLAAAGVACFGPGREAARLESSKAFMKEICAAAGAPTAAYGHFQNAGDAKAYSKTQNAPFVIKADGLAAGKGVVIAADQDEAELVIDQMLDGKFGAASAEIIVEEFMAGEAAGCFKTLLCWAGARLASTACSENSTVTAKWRSRIPYIESVRLKSSNPGNVGTGKKDISQATGSPAVVRRRTTR